MKLPRINSNPQNMNRFGGNRDERGFSMSSRLAVVIWRLWGWSTDTWERGGVVPVFSRPWATYGSCWSAQLFGEFLQRKMNKTHLERRGLGCQEMLSQCFMAAFLPGMALPTGVGKRDHAWRFAVGARYHQAFIRTVWGGILWLLFCIYFACFVVADRLCLYLIVCDYIYVFIHIHTIIYGDWPDYIGGTWDVLIVLLTFCSDIRRLLMRGDSVFAKSEWLVRAQDTSWQSVAILARW